MIRKSDRELAKKIDESLSHYRVWHFHPTQPPDFDDRDGIVAFVIEGSIWVHNTPHSLSVSRMIAPEIIYRVMDLDTITETIVADMAKAILNQLLKKD